MPTKMNVTKKMKTKKRKTIVMTTTDLLPINLHIKGSVRLKSHVMTLIYIRAFITTGVAEL